MMAYRSYIRTLNELLPQQKKQLWTISLIWFPFAFLSYWRKCRHRYTARTTFYQSAQPVPNVNASKCADVLQSGACHSLAAHLSRKHLRAFPLLCISFKWMLHTLERKKVKSLRSAPLPRLSFLWCSTKEHTPSIRRRYLSHMTSKPLRIMQN